MLLRPLYWDLDPFLAWQSIQIIFWFSCFHWLLICKMIYKYTPHRTVYSSSRTSCKPLEVNREFFSVALIKHLIDFVIFLQSHQRFSDTSHCKHLDYADSCVSTPLLSCSRWLSKWIKQFLLYWFCESSLAWPYLSLNFSTWAKCMCVLHLKLVYYRFPKA